MLTPASDDSHSPSGRQPHSFAVPIHLLLAVAEAAATLDVFAILPASPYPWSPFFALDVIGAAAPSPAGAATVGALAASAMRTAAAVGASPPPASPFRAPPDPPPDPY